MPKYEVQQMDLDVHYISESCAYPYIYIEYTKVHLFIGDRVKHLLHLFCCVNLC